MARGKPREKRKDVPARDTSVNEEQAEQGGITKERLASFHNKVATLKSDSDEIRGEIGQEFKQFEETGGEKWCYKVVAKLASLPPDKRKDAFFTIIKYAEMLSIFAQGDLLDPTFEKVAELVNELADEDGGGVSAAPPVPDVPKAAAH